MSDLRNETPERSAKIKFGDTYVVGWEGVEEISQINLELLRRANLSIVNSGNFSQLAILLPMQASVSAYPYWQAPSATAALTPKSLRPVWFSLVLGEVFHIPDFVQSG